MSGCTELHAPLEADSDSQNILSGITCWDVLDIQQCRILCVAHDNSCDLSDDIHNLCDNKKEETL